MSYREILVYTSTDELAHRICEYAANLASFLKARLIGVVVETDVIDLSKLDSAILDKGWQEAFDLWSSDELSCMMPLFVPAQSFKMQPSSAPYDATRSLRLARQRKSQT